jgi:alkaline phosphatase D
MTYITFQATGHDDFLPTILLSLPSSSRRLRITNFAVNTLLLLAAADFLATPFLDSASDVVFSRVGAVYPDSVKIVVRYPQRDITEDKLRVVWRESKGTAAQQSDKWKDGPVLHFTEERDWVDTVKLDGLWPSTAYECQSLQQSSFHHNPDAGLYHLTIRQTLDH